ncbi:unnamed protein product, partial [Symbiodinium pilosum]
DGLLTSGADFSRALQKLYPKLFIYDLDEMGPELRARAVDELRQLDANVEQSWKQFSAGALRPRQTWQEAPAVPTSSSCPGAKAQDIAHTPPNGECALKPVDVQSPGEVRELSRVSSSSQILQPRAFPRETPWNGSSVARFIQADVQAATPARQRSVEAVPVRNNSARILPAVPYQGVLPARTLEQADLRSISPRVLTASPSQTSLLHRAQEVSSSPRLVPVAALQPSSLPRQIALSAAPVVSAALTPRSVSPRLQEQRSASPCILPERPCFVANGLPTQAQGCRAPIHTAWLDPSTPRRSLPSPPMSLQHLQRQPGFQQCGLPPPPGISFTLKPELPKLQLQPMALAVSSLASSSGPSGPSAGTPRLAPLSPRVPGLF